MKKDINIPEVKDVAMAVVKEKNDEGHDVWNAYLLNMKNVEIYGVLVASKGYGQKDGENVKTSTLRHFLDTVPARNYAKVEAVMDNLLGLSNEFWVSFYVDRVIYDKKYIFLPETIVKENLVNIPLINKPGVMIK